MYVTGLDEQAALILVIYLHLWLEWCAKTWCWMFDLQLIFWWLSKACDHRNENWLFNPDFLGRWRIQMNLGLDCIKGSERLAGHRVDFTYPLSFCLFPDEHVELCFALWLGVVSLSAAASSILWQWFIPVFQQTQTEMPPTVTFNLRMDLSACVFACVRLKHTLNNWPEIVSVMFGACLFVFTTSLLYVSVCICACMHLFVCVIMWFSSEWPQEESQWHPDIEIKTLDTAIQTSRKWGRTF